MRDLLNGKERIIYNNDRFACRAVLFFAPNGRHKCLEQAKQSFLS